MQRKPQQHQPGVTRWPTWPRHLATRAPGVTRGSADAIRRARANLAREAHRRCANGARTAHGMQRRPRCRVRGRVLDEPAPFDGTSARSAACVTGSNVDADPLLLTLAVRAMHATAVSSRARYTHNGQPASFSGGSQANRRVSIDCCQIRSVRRSRSTMLRSPPSRNRRRNLPRVTALSRLDSMEEVDGCSKSVLRVLRNIGQCS